METMQSILKRGREVWDQVNMPKAEFQQRVEKIKKQMKKEGINVLLLYGNALNEYGDLCYVSNYTSAFLMGSLVAITDKGEVTLIFEGAAREVTATKSITWVEDIRPCDEVAQACVTYLKEKNLIPSTIGFVGLRQFIPCRQFQSLSASIDQCDIVDSDSILRKMRMVKSQRECDQIRRSARIVSHVFGLISETTIPSRTEKVVEATINREACLEGVGDIRILIARPQETTWTFRPAEDVPISAGETFVIYLAVEFERYWSEGIRTFLTKDSVFAKPRFDNIVSLYERIMDSMKPGKRMFEFYDETMRKMDENKFVYIPEYGLGHGIGLGLEESPVINRKDKTPIKEGMCVTLRLLIKDREMGAIIMGNTVHVSKSGPEIFTK